MILEIVSSADFPVSNVVEGLEVVDGSTKIGLLHPQMKATLSKQLLEIIVEIPIKYYIAIGMTYLD